MKPFEDTYGILALAASPESNLKKDKDFDKDDFVGELEIVLHSVNSKVSADRNVLGDNTEPFYKKLLKSMSYAICATMPVQQHNFSIILLLNCSQTEL